MKISKGTQTAGTVFKFKGKRPFAHNRIQMHGICENSVQGVCVRGGCWGILCFPAFASESQLSQSRKVEENKERNTTCLAVRTMSIHIATAFFPRRSVVLLSCLFSPNVWDTGKKKKVQLLILWQGGCDDQDYELSKVTGRDLRVFLPQEQCFPRLPETSCPQDTWFSAQI